MNQTSEAEPGEGLAGPEGDDGKEDIACERQSGLGSSMAAPVFLPG